MAKKKTETITNITGRELDPHGRFEAKYNRPKRFLRTFFTKYFLPSIITAGLAVAAVVAFPIFSTAVSLTAGNLALVGAGAFVATSCAIGTGTLINNKLSARRKVKNALKRGGDSQATLFNSIEGQPRQRDGKIMSSGLATKGRRFWRRRDMLWQYLKQNRKNQEGRFSNRELVQNIIDSNDTRYFIDLIMLAAKKGYLGEEQQAYAKNKENAKALKNIKYMTEEEADDLLSGMFGVENHMKTEGVDTYYQAQPKTTRRSRKAIERAADESLIAQQIAQQSAANQPVEAIFEGVNEEGEQAKENTPSQLMEEMARQAAAEQQAAEDAARKREETLEESLEEFNNIVPAKTPTIVESSSLTGKMLSGEIDPNENPFDEKPKGLHLTDEVLSQDKEEVQANLVFDATTNNIASKTAPKVSKRHELKLNFEVKAPNSEMTR